MRTKRVLIIFLFLIVIIAMNSCSFNITSVDNLIRAPKLTGNNSALQIAFEKAVGKNTTLKTPSNGNYRSAYILYDFDGDGVEEALVFYSLNSDELVVRMNILEQTDNTWISVGDFTGFGSEVYKIDFVDLNDNNREEIIVCWKQTEANINKVMSIYGGYATSELANSSISTLATEYYSSMIPIDLDGDNQNEILFTYIDTISERYLSYAKLLKLSKDGKVSLVGETQINSNISSYSTFKYDIIDGKYRAYVDAFSGDTQMLTEVIYWDDNGKLIAPFFNSDVGIPPKTLRNLRIPSTDINFDTLIEIPLTVPIEGGNIIDLNNDKTSPIYLVNWSAYQEDRLEIVKRTYCNLNDSYMFAFPEEWLGNITIQYDINDRICTFFSYNSRTAEKNHELFSFKAFPVDSFQVSMLDEYTQFLTTSSFTYSFKISQNGLDFGLTEEFVAEQFGTLNFKAI